MLIPDTITGLIGALGALMFIRDRARNRGSYHVHASLAAAAYLLDPDAGLGLYASDLVTKIDGRIKWESMSSSLFVFELVDVVIRGWKRGILGDPIFRASPFKPPRSREKWGTFDLFEPVVNLGNEGVTPRWPRAPVPPC